jgi:hypothetical protein
MGPLSRYLERNDSVCNNLLLPWRGYTILGMEDVELSNHSRERRPYISKLLDETYNGIRLYETFHGEQRRAYLVLCRIPPDVRSGHANTRCRYTERKAWNAITHPVDDPLQIQQPTLCASAFFITQQRITYRVPESGHRPIG